MISQAITYKMKGKNIQEKFNTYILLLIDYVIKKNITNPVTILSINKYEPKTNYLLLLLAPIISLITFNEQFITITFETPVIEVPKYIKGPYYASRNA